MLEGVVHRQPRAERLAADRPALDAELGADRLEAVDVGRHAVGGRIVRRAGPPVSEQFHDDRRRVGGERGQVRPPLGAAGTDAMDEQHVRRAAIAVGFDVHHRWRH